MEKLSNIHPGEVLLHEFLEPLEISAYRLSKDLLIPQTRISQILKGNRRITTDTALRLSKYFGNQLNFGSECKTTMTLKKKRNLRKSNLMKSNISKIITLPNNG